MVVVEKRAHSEALLNFGTQICIFSFAKKALLFATDGVRVLH